MGQGILTIGSISESGGQTTVTIKSNGTLIEGWSSPYIGTNEVTYNSESLKVIGDSGSEITLDGTWTSPPAEDDVVTMGHYIDPSLGATGTYDVLDAINTVSAEPPYSTFTQIMLYGIIPSIGDQISFGGKTQETFTVTNVVNDYYALLDGAFGTLPVLGDQVTLWVGGGQGGGGGGGGGGTDYKTGLVPSSEVRVAKEQLVSAVRDVTKADFLPAVHSTPALQDNIRVAKGQLIRN